MFGKGEFGRDEDFATSAIEVIGKVCMSSREYLLVDAVAIPRPPELSCRGDPVEEGAYWESSPPKES